MQTDSARAASARPPASKREKRKGKPKDNRFPFFHAHFPVRSLILITEVMRNALPWSGDRSCGAVFRCGRAARQSAVAMLDGASAGRGGHCGRLVSVSKYLECAILPRGRERNESRCLEEPQVSVRTAQMYFPYQITKNAALRMFCRGTALLLRVGCRAMRRSDA